MRRFGCWVIVLALINLLSSEARCGYVDILDGLELKDVVGLPESQVPQAVAKLCDESDTMTKRRFSAAAIFAAHTTESVSSLCEAANNGCFVEHDVEGICGIAAFHKANIGLLKTGDREKHFCGLLERCLEKSEKTKLSAAKIEARLSSCLGETTASAVVGLLRHGVPGLQTLFSEVRPMAILNAQEPILVESAEGGWSVVPYSGKAANVCYGLLIKELAYDKNNKSSFVEYELSTGAMGPTIGILSRMNDRDELTGLWILVPTKPRRDKPDGSPVATF